MKRKELLTLCFIFLITFFGKAQVATCELYTISDIVIDTSGSTNKMEITISSNDTSIVHLNNTYIDFVLNSNNDTIANGTFFYFYAHAGGQTKTYKAPTSISVLPTHFNYSVALAYVDLFNNYNDTSCVLSFSKMTTSLNNPSFKSTELAIYSNPVLKKSVIIGFKSDQYIKPNLFIYDMQGRMMIEKSLTTNKIEIDVSNFSKGIYYARLIGKNGKHGCGKIVIQ